MFGSALSTDTRVAGGLAIAPSSTTPNGVRKSGFILPARPFSEIDPKVRTPLKIVKEKTQDDGEREVIDLSLSRGDSVVGRTLRPKGLCGP